jgi:hypothetical protein
MPNPASLPGDGGAFPPPLHPASDNRKQAKNSRFPPTAPIDASAPGRPRASPRRNPLFSVFEALFDPGRVDSQLTPAATLAIRFPHTGNFPSHSGLRIQTWEIS